MFNAHPTGTVISRRTTWSEIILSTVSAKNRSQTSTTWACSFFFFYPHHLITLLSPPHPTSPPSSPQSVSSPSSSPPPPPLTTLPNPPPPHPQHTHTHTHTRPAQRDNLPCCRRQQRPFLSWRENQAADSSQRRTWLPWSLCSTMRSRTSQFSMKTIQLQNNKSLSVQLENIRRKKNGS